MLTIHAVEQLDKKNLNVIKKKSKKTQDLGLPSEVQSPFMGVMYMYTYMHMYMYMHLYMHMN
jgi:hypothetical protein